jgi:hypothetical protein
MDFKKYTIVLNLASIASLILLLILPELIKVPYAFYTAMKFIIMCTTGFSAYILYTNNVRELSYILGILALLFNPIFPIYLTRTFWMFVDIIAITLLIYAILKIRKKSDAGEVHAKNSILDGEIQKLLKYEKRLDDEDDESEQLDTIRLIGISLGHFNEGLLRHYHKENNIDFITGSVASSIKRIDSFYDKTTISDLFFINQVRNKIVHSGDRLHIDADTLDYFKADIKSAIAKCNFLYKRL